MPSTSLSPKVTSKHPTTITPIVAAMTACNRKRRSSRPRRRQSAQGTSVIPERQPEKPKQKRHRRQPALGRVMDIDVVKVSIVGVRQRSHVRRHEFREALPHAFRADAKPGIGRDHPRPGPPHDQPRFARTRVCDRLQPVARRAGCNQKNGRQCDGNRQQQLPPPLPNQIANSGQQRDPDAARIAQHQRNAANHAAAKPDAAARTACALGKQQIAEQQKKQQHQRLAERHPMTEEARDPVGSIGRIKIDSPFMRGSPFLSKLHDAPERRHQGAGKPGFSEPPPLIDGSKQRKDHDQDRENEKFLELRQCGRQIAGDGRGGHGPCQKAGERPNHARQAQRRLGEKQQQERYRQAGVRNGDRNHGGRRGDERKTESIAAERVVPSDGRGSCTNGSRHEANQYANPSPSAPMASDNSWSIRPKPTSERRRISRFWFCEGRASNRE